MFELFVRHANDANPQLVIVDELHNLSDGRRHTIDAANMLKTMTNAVNATFVYGGIGVHSGPLMSGPQGNQLASRSTSHVLRPVSLAEPAGAAEWVGLIRAFELQLCLADHEVGSLAHHAEYLFQRTAGSIGTLRQLLVDAALDVIAESSPSSWSSAEAVVERIDLERIESLRTDLRAELGGLQLSA